MLKRLTAALFLLFSLQVFAAQEPERDNSEKEERYDNAKTKETEAYSFDEDYFVGLKAFDDGFFDVSRISLAEFLKKDGVSQRAGFAAYLLYQSHMKEGDYKSAKNVFRMLAGFKDDRFDQNKMAYDEMAIETKLDCDDAEKFLLSGVDGNRMAAYISSDCPITKKIANFAAKEPFSPETLYLLIDKAADDKKMASLIYKNLSPEKKTPEILNFYGRYFAANKMDKDFWELYAIFKDRDTVTLALDKAWTAKDYSGYAEIFEKDVKEEYKLSRTVYCRMIESSNKTGKIFNCDIIDGCMDKKSPDFTKSKLACFMKNEDKAGIRNIMKEITPEEAAGLCEYGDYIIGKNLYNIDFVGKFSGCPKRASMYESMTRTKDYNGIMRLAGNNREQTDIAYLALASYFAGNNKDAEGFLKELTDPDLIKMVKTRIGGDK